MKISEKKNKFRQTKEWKEWRKKIAENQNNIDIITGKKLYKGFNCHHLDMSSENYEQLIEENFIAVNKNTHEIIHNLFRYYKTDETILERLKEVLDQMKKLNK